VKAVDHTFADIELPKPSPGPRDLLVKVEAVSVNPVDYKQRKQASSSKVLGWDAAGTVQAVGSETKLFKPGDAVYYAGDVTRPGCDSEFHLVDERIVGRKPNRVAPRLHRLGEGARRRPDRQPPAGSGFTGENPG
jgi:NADPH:quinone reductase-like Zn-dependent oxidoreductase